MTNYKISIVSDTICPWCYVGKNRLQVAITKHLQSHPTDTFATTWYPFYLNPDAPKQSRDKQTIYVEKFGAQRVEMMQHRLSEIGAELGINFAYGGKTGNTRDSHRVVQLAKLKGEETQTRVMEKLFNAYFEKNEDITDHAVLTKAAVGGGLEEQEVKEWLSSDKGGPEVDREVAAAQRRFISGVPHFTIQGKYEVGGAEEPATFLRIFEEVKKSEGGSGTTQVSSGNTC
ncbi:thioredoxin-like protein [Aureobasidium subglaciale]|nr:thioredoxin-like protein [Aureobasidium subglaciale]KAI5269697.1 thioredoxin-like protein [Aureobasidium subglaciale]